MSTPKIGKWFDERIEMYLDGELDTREERLFESELAINTTLQDELEKAQSVTSMLRAMPSYRSPVDMTQRLERMISTPRKRRWKLPSAIAASVAAVSFALITLFSSQQPARPTDAEIAAAERDLALALAYLDRAGDTASRNVVNSVIGDGLLVPVRRSLDSQSRSTSSS